MFTVQFPQAFQWLELFAGTAMATRCVEGAGYQAGALDIKYYDSTVKIGRHNFYDMLSPAGMAPLSSLDT